MVHRKTSESGSALILALFFGIVVVGLVISGSIQMRSHRQTTSTQFQLYSQATQFARSGLTEALSWFRRQPAQPVTTFEPVVDLTANPPVTDTIDPDIGIVREFRISGSTWGRYEVWKEWAADPDPDRAAWRAQMQSTDVSTQLGLGTAGASWRIRGVGYLYQLNDDSIPFDTAPNRVLASRILESELLRLKISPPAQAALSIQTGTNATVNSYGRIDGGATGAGIFYSKYSGPANVGEWWEGRVTGSPAQSEGTYDASYKSVFGITYEELRSIADAYITDQTAFPNPVPTNTITVVESPGVIFDATRALKGTGLVVIKGDVAIFAGSASNFTGFLYVDGNLTMLSPCSITGAVVVTGTFASGGTGDYATITFDDDALTSLRLEIGQYRMSGAIRPIHSRE